jgi:hypothetical protein
MRRKKKTQAKRKMKYTRQTGWRRRLPAWSQKNRHEHDHTSTDTAVLFSVWWT